MKPLSDSLKTYLPLLLVLVLILTLLGDHLQAPPEIPDTQTMEDGHTHEHDHPAKPPVPPEKAFGQPPDPKAVPPDPEREHRMAVFHYNEGNAYLKKNDWQEAVRNYKMALHHDKNLKEALVNLSTAYLKGQHYGDARIALARLEDLDPDHPHLHYNLACYHSLTGHPAEALESLQRALELGYPRPGDIPSDPDLENLRRTEAFRQWFQTRNKKN